MTASKRRYTMLHGCIYQSELDALSSFVYHHFISWVAKDIVVGMWDNCVINPKI